MSEPLVFTFTSAIKEGKLKEYEHAHQLRRGFKRLPALPPEKGDAR
jgi:hypothetical protein